MHTPEYFQNFINGKIETELKNLERKPSELYEPIRYIMSMGGKRLRPCLVLLSCNLFSKDVEKAVFPAIGLEIFHNFTLVHDDIMDNASVRRSKPTIHTKWNQNIAILSGDAMSIVAYDFISRCHPVYLPEVLKVFNKTALEVCEGQQYDMNFESAPTVTIPDYIEMIKLKTSVLLAACAKIGAIIGEAPADDAEKLYDFGLNLGISFQLQDDLLDVYGETNVFGKKIGGDIVSNKKTFLMIQALQMAKGETLKEFIKQLTFSDFNAEDKIRVITSIYNQLNIKDLTKTEIEKYHQKAVKSLEDVNLPSEKKKILLNFVVKMLKRDF